MFWGILRHFVLSEISSVWIQMVSRMKSGAAGAAVYRVTKSLLLPLQPHHAVAAYLVPSLHHLLASFNLITSWLVALDVPSSVGGRRMCQLHGRTSTNRKEKKSISALHSRTVSKGAARVTHSNKKYL